MQRQRQQYLLIAGIAVAALMFCLVGSVVAYLAWPSRGGVFGRSAPPGYSTAHEPSGKFSVFVPGSTRKEIVYVGRTQMEAVGHYLWFIGSGEVNALSPIGYVRSDRLNDGFNPGTGPDDLANLIQPYDWLTDLFSAPSQFEIKSKHAIVLDGKPAVEVRLQEKFNPMGGPGEEFWKEHNRKTKEKLERDGQRGVYLVTVHGRQVIFIRLVQRGRFPDDQILDTIKQSFRFVD